MTEFTANASGLLVPAEKPPEPRSMPAPTETTEFVGPQLSPEEIKKRTSEIALRLLWNVLLDVDWETCLPRAGGIQLPHREFKGWFGEQIGEAARAMKASGIGWEQWT